MDDNSVRRLRVSTYSVLTPEPEADGTATCDATDLVVVEPTAGEHTGLGWSYCAAPAAARVVEELLAPVALGSDVLDIPGTWQAMARAVRNAGRPGVVSMALAAVDTALADHQRLEPMLLDGRAEGADRRAAAQRPAGQRLRARRPRRPLPYVDLRPELVRGRS